MSVSCGVKGLWARFPVALRGTPMCAAEDYADRDSDLGSAADGSWASDAVFCLFFRLLCADNTNGTERITWDDSCQVLNEVSDPSIAP